MSIPSYCKHPRGSFPWDIYKLVSDSPHGLDIFFFCNLPQLLADICNDTEYRATYIHRILLPDRLIDLFFRVDSSWLTGKVHQSLKFIRFRQRKHLPLVRNLVLDWINAKTGILKNPIIPWRWLLCIESCQKLLCHLSSWIRGTEDDFNLFHYTSPVKI